MKSMRQARSTRPTPLRVAGFVLLCLASLLAGCSNDGAAPSTPPASTQQAEQHETAENDAAGDERGGGSGAGANRNRARTESESLYALQPTLRCLERRPRLATSSAATTPSAAGAARPGSTDIRHRATRRRERRNRRGPEQCACESPRRAPARPGRPSSHHPTPERRVALPPASAGRVRRRGGLSTPGRLRQGVAHDQLRLGQAVLERCHLQIVVSRRLPPTDVQPQPGRPGPRHRAQPNKIERSSPTRPGSPSDPPRATPSHVEFNDQSPPSIGQFDAPYHSPTNPRLSPSAFPFTCNRNTADVTVAPSGNADVSNRNNPTNT